MRKMHYCDLNTNYCKIEAFQMVRRAQRRRGWSGDACVLNVKAAVEKREKKKLFFTCTCAKLPASSLARVPSSRPTLDSDLPRHLQ